MDINTVAKELCRLKDERDYNGRKELESLINLFEVMLKELNQLYDALFTCSKVSKSSLTFNPTFSCTFWKIKSVTYPCLLQSLSVSLNLSSISFFSCGNPSLSLKSKVINQSIQKRWMLKNTIIITLLYIFRFFWVGVVKKRHENMHD